MELGDVSCMCCYDHIGTLMMAFFPSRKMRSRTRATKPRGKWAANRVRNQGVAYRLNIKNMA